MDPLIGVRIPAPEPISRRDSREIVIGCSKRCSKVAAGELGARCGFASLFTESQGEFHTPWAVFVGGAAYVTTGDDAGRALRALDRPLKRAELERLTR